jgi:hypothetical protein
MKKLINLFTEHPNSIGKGYFSHMYQALGFSFQMFVGATACTIHAFLPFLFQTTASTRIKNLYKEIKDIEYKKTGFHDLGV